MTNFVVFGASGDLANNYLYPSLYRLFQQGVVFNYIGFGRTPMSDSAFQAIVQKSTGSIKFSCLFHYYSGNYDSSGLSVLKSVITPQSIYYFSLPTRLDIVTPLISGLVFHSLINPQLSTIVLEKPFGVDYTSAKTIMDFLTQTINPQTVFLVDHYLTKELVRNIISLRFANPIFSHLWNKKYIKEINIIAAEKETIGERGEYYDKTGAIRDMVQNHCLQILTLMIMDRPQTLDYVDYKSQKLKVLNNLSLFGDGSKNLKIGQYKGYLQEHGVMPDSKTETFAHLRLQLDHPNWQDVPLNITTGKKLDQKLTEITVVFKNDDQPLWGQAGESLVPNQLTINLYPDNDIVLTINSEFNPQLNIPKPINLHLGSLDSSSVVSTTYENVIQDIINHNRLNTPSFEEILAQWQIVDHILATPNLKSKLFCY